MDDRSVPTWLPRVLAAVVVTGFVAAGAWWVLGRLRTLIFMVFVALFISFALEPAVQFLAKRGWRRGAGTVAVFLGAFIAVAAFIAALIPVFAGQASDLIAAAPSYIENAEDLGRRWFGLELSFERIQEAFSSSDDLFQRYADDMIGSVVGVGTAVFKLIFSAVSILLFAFYLVSDGPKLRRIVLGTFRPERQREVNLLWETAIAKTGGYVYSRALLALVATLIMWVAFAILGLPSAFALALWVGVLSQLIPVVGVLLAAVPPALVALFESPIKALWVIALLVAYQQIENYWIAPKITARTMAIHPAVAFASVVAGAALFGAIGAILALPTAATFQAFAGTFIARHELADGEEAVSDEPAVPA